MTVIIVQARMSSTRLPGKVLKTVLGQPLLHYLLERLRVVKHADSLVVATTTNPRDRVILDFCQKENIPTFAGSEENVLARFHNAAHAHSAKTIVRICSDCPLIDPSIVDDCIDLYAKSSVDYVSNTLERTYPRGMDVEVFSARALQRAANEAQEVAEREHVTPYIYRHPEKFSLKQLKQSDNTSDYRLTVDTQEDFELIKHIIETLYPQNPLFNYRDIINLLKDRPDWVKINAHVPQKKL